MQKDYPVSSTSENFGTEDGVIVSSKDFDDRGFTWSVSKTTLKGGSQDGVELITVDSGRLSFRVIPTRGMSVLDAQVGNVRLGWDSPVKQVIHPKHVDLNDHGGRGWLSAFNEMMVRCGVGSAGAPGDDGGHFLNLHGHIGNIPASEVLVSVEENDHHELRIRVRGKVEEKRFKFGVFELWTEVSCIAGGTRIDFHDKLVNESEYDREYQMIYHANFGPPFLEQGAKFVGSVKSIEPIDDYAAKDVDRYETYLGPTKHFGEQVYCMTLNTDESGNATTMLRNESGDLGIVMRHHVDALPFFNLWKNTDTIKDGYVTGLEPATGFPRNRSLEREAGRVPTLAAGESVTFQMSIEYVEGERVAEMESQISGNATG